MVFINKQNTRVACRDGGEIPYLSMLMYSFYLMKNVKDEDVKMYIYMHLAVMWLKLFHRRCNGGILCNFTKFCIKWPFTINQPTDSLIVFCIPLLKLKLMRQEKQTHCTVNNHILSFLRITLKKLDQPNFSGNQAKYLPSFYSQLLPCSYSKQHASIRNLMTVSFTRMLSIIQW